jgi:hypothetical protein
MAHVCERKPYGLDRVLRRHAGETGVVVYGWFGRALRGWTPKGSWAAVVVKVDGKQQSVLTQLKRGPFWIDVRPGTHRLEFFTSGRTLRSEELTLEEGQVMLAAFRPPNHRPIASLRSEEWCFRRL